MPIVEGMMRIPARPGPRRRSAGIWPALILLAGIAVCPVAAETVLLATFESIDGSPCAPPLPLREGLSAQLFEEGHIVFDDGDSSETRRTDALVSLAVAGGAAWVLEAAVEFSETQVAAALARISARVTWRLTRASDGSPAGTGSLTATNEGREKLVDLARLGREIGTAIASALGDPLASAW